LASTSDENKKEFFIGVYNKSEIA